jgi:hypothetical protein
MTGDSGRSDFSAQRPGAGASRPAPSANPVRQWRGRYGDDDGRHICAAIIESSRPPAAQKKFRA